MRKNIFYGMFLGFFNVHVQSNQSIHVFKEVMTQAQCRHRPVQNSFHTDFALTLGKLIAKLDA